MNVKQLLGAAALVAVAGCGVNDPLINEDYSSGDDPGSSATGNTKSPTDYIVEQVSRQYSEQSGRTLYVSCPDEVELRQGVELECEALDVDNNDEKYANVIVTIKNARGDFDWTATPVN